MVVLLYAFGMLINIHEIISISVKYEHMYKFKCNLLLTRVKWILIDILLITGSNRKECLAAYSSYSWLSAYLYLFTRICNPIIMRNIFMNHTHHLIRALKRPLFHVGSWTVVRSKEYCIRHSTCCRATKELLRVNFQCIVWIGIYIICGYWRTISCIFT